jgi:hypothetical protein
MRQHAVRLLSSNALLLYGLCLFAHADQEIWSLEWTELRHIEQTADGFRTVDHDPWLISKELDRPISTQRRFLLVEMRASKPIRVEIRWWNVGQALSDERTIRFQTPGELKRTTRLLDLAEYADFQGLQAIRLDPGNDAGVEFNIDRLEFLELRQVPKEQVADLIGLRCVTSKLHFLPGEPIPYRLRLSAQNYPDRESSKIAEIKVVNQQGEVVATDVQHYGLMPMYRIRELTGVINTPRPLPPGRYELRATSTDQRSGLQLRSIASFGVQANDDPLVLETPFKFVKDFSIVHDTNGTWHLFSITGDLAAGHDWMPLGQERTFSHSTSRDLRHWTFQRPVLSITNDQYADGNGHYQNRNIWAPHVIRRNDIYYMFYTSVNTHVSQSISLATSKDLFHWTPHKQNPVFTLENVPWANWTRDRWADCRDPMVLEDEGRYYLYVTAHAAEGDPRGVVAVADSTNLVDWRNPRIALRYRHACESPQVWKRNDTYFMTTSAAGGGTWTSDHPDSGWHATDFPRPPVQQRERYVETSPSYAEEVVSMSGNQLLMASMTFRYWGNTIYFFRVMHDESGAPIGYESPWDEISPHVEEQMAESRNESDLPSKHR